MACTKGDSIAEYQSKRWCRSDRMHYAPSLHRTCLSETLAESFSSNHREKWLENASSSIFPSRKPIDPAEETRPLTAQEKREKFIANRASYLRIKSCPPEYMLPRRYYANIIARNRTFAQECKTITGILPIDTRDGESFRSFLLGAKYTDLRYVAAGMITKRDARISTSPKSAAKVRNVSPKVDTGRIRSGERPSSNTQSKPATPTAPTTTPMMEVSPATPTVSTHDLPPSTPTPTTTRRRKLGHYSPSPIAVFGSNPQLPALSMQTDEKLQEDSLIGPPVQTETVAMQTSGVAVESEPGSIVSMEEGSVHFSEVPSDAIEKPMGIIEENDKDMISLEAQKLTGDILHESQMDEGQENLQREGSEEKLSQSSEDAPLPLQQPHEDELPEQGSDLDMQGAELTPVSRKSPHSQIDKVDIKFDVTVDHEKEMTSRSSTIFVDMMGLNIDSHEPEETPD